MTEHEEREAIARHLTPGARVLEGGAGEGNATGALLDAGAALVVAFEPQGQPFRRLLHRHDADERLVPIHGALVGEPGKPHRLTVSSEWMETTGSATLTFEPEGVIYPTTYPLNAIRRHFNLDTLILDIEGDEARLLPILAFDDPPLELLIFEDHPRLYTSEDRRALVFALAVAGMIEVECKAGDPEAGTFHRVYRRGG